MNTYSSRLILVGLMLGILVVSAFALARNAPAKPAASTTEKIVLLQPREEDPAAAWGAPAAPVLATRPARGPGLEDGYFYVALRVDMAKTPGSLYLCDREGCPILPAEPDAEGDAALGPMPPGDYSICAAGQTLGRFSLLANAAVTGAEGLLWTDGELLHLSDKPTGEAVLQLTLPAPGYYSLCLVDRWGGRYQQDLFIPKSEYPDRDGEYLRTLSFRGLPEGLYTAVYAKEPLVQFTVTAQTPAQAELRLERKQS